MVATPELVAAPDPRLPQEQNAHREIFKDRPDWSQGGIYTEATLRAYQHHLDFARTSIAIGVSLANQVDDDWKYHSGRALSPEHLFPELQDPSKWATKMWSKTRAFLATWGEAAAIVLSLFAMGRLVTTVVAWFYGVAVLREVVGWSRRLAWTLCPNIFLLRQFREYNRGPPADPTAPPPGADAEGGYPVRKEGVWTTDKNAAKRDTVFLEEAARVHRPQGHGHGRPNPHRKKELDDEVV